MNHYFMNTKKSERHSSVRLMRQLNELKKSENWCRKKRVNSIEMQVSICHRYRRRDLQACNLPTFFFFPFVNISRSSRRDVNVFLCVHLNFLFPPLKRRKKLHHILHRMTQFSIPPSPIMPYLFLQVHNEFR